MTEYVVPMGTPQFLRFGYYPETGPGLTWAGAYPYIDTADTDTSYGEVDSTVAGLDRYVGYFIPAYVAPAGIVGARLDFQMYFETIDATYHGPQWFMTSDAPAVPWSWNGGPYPDVDHVGWNTYADTYLFDPAYGAPISDMLAALVTGLMYVSVHQASPATVFKVSQLRLTLISSAAPLRQVQRDDGLGRSVVRARGGTSVQRSIRQRGYR